jgi:hypothetical protein
MSNLDVAVATFWQLARHWKNGEKAKLELSCEGESLHIQLSAKLGPPEQQHFPDPPQIIPPVKKKSPSQLRRQERRRQEANSKTKPSTTKESEQDTTENISVIEEAEKLKESSNTNKNKSSKKDIPDKARIFSKEAGHSKACAKETPINPSEEEEEILSSCLVFKCDQCNYSSSSYKGLKINTRMKHRISQLDGHGEEVESDILQVNEEGDIGSPNITDLYSENPPATVIHPLLGREKYFRRNSFGCYEYDFGNDEVLEC